MPQFFASANKDGEAANGFRDDIESGPVRPVCGWSPPPPLLEGDEG